MVDESLFLTPYIKLTCAILLYHLDPCLEQLLEQSEIFGALSVHDQASDLLRYVPRQGRSFEIIFSHRITWILGIIYVQTIETTTNLTGDITLCCKVYSVPPNQNLSENVTYIR
jgi:hypothetical protein